MKTHISLTTALACLVAAGAAHAAQQPDYMNGHQYHESVVDPQPRAQRDVVHDPGWQLPAWQHFVTSEGGSWHGIWDRHTQVPLRIYGSGIAFPGAVQSADRAERNARTVLSRHLGLLAPGATVNDFAVAGNELHRGMRTVVFQQHYLGLPVVDARVSFLFKHDRLIVIGSEAVPTARALQGQVTSAQVSVGNAAAEASARGWIARDFGDDAQVVSVEGPVVASVISAPGPSDQLAPIRSAGALVVTVVTHSSPGLWQVYVDMNTGSPVARKQMLRFGSGQVLYNTPERWPGADRSDYPAIEANTNVDGNVVISGVDGMVDWAGTGTVPITVQVDGPYVELINAGSGGDLTASGTIADGGSFLVDRRNSEFEDAQLTGFVHGAIAKQEARLLNPTLPWLDSPLQVTVNMPSDLLGMLFCNAYSDGNTINFFESFSLPPFIECGNTARLPDVVYHEFGHSLHAQSLTTGAFEAALSEGLSDYYAATIQDDPGMGRGFFNTDEPLRHIDPAGSEASWPEDIAQDPHTTGLIIAGALWDLRKELVTSMGPAAGRAYADQLFYAALQQSVDIPSTYPQVLAADDDDGNLANGTPNSCIINQVFADHGLANPLLGGFLVVDPIERDGYQVSFQRVQSQGVCPPPQVNGADLIWQLREDPAIGGTVPMALAGDLFSAEIPPQEDGQVVQYKVSMQLDNGETGDFPRNPADPMYEFYVGEVHEIYCTDFESDPFMEGWISQASAGPDDWAWGMPMGGGGDPTTAYSGTGIVGNNLNGSYAPNSANALTSPEIDISGYGNVRLQYRRWLMVEDGVFDQAVISANGMSMWQNQAGDPMFGGINHVDGEWRFHDVDLTSLVGSGSVQLSFSVTSDPGLEMGGWSIDDLCVVSRLYCGDGYATEGEECDQGAANSDIVPDACRSNCVAATCGDGVVDSAEACDNGASNSDSSADACRTTCVAATCGDGVIDTGEACDDQNLVDGDGCSSLCATEGDVGGGCGCAASEPGAGDALLWSLMLLGLAVITRRRRRRSAAH